MLNAFPGQSAVNSISVRGQKTDNFRGRSGNSPYRKDITLRPEIKKGFQFGDDAAEGKEKGEFKNYTWSKMLAQVFKIDVTKCGQCGGDLVKVCAITDPMQARRYLKHVGLDYEPPPRAPPRHEQGEFHFESDDWSSEHLS